MRVLEIKLDVLSISDDISQVFVTNVTNQICGVFNKAARKTFGLLYHKNSPISNESNKKKKNHGLMEILEQHKENLIWQSEFFIDVTQENKDNLKVLSKTYKKWINALITIKQI